MYVSLQIRCVDEVHRQLPTFLYEANPQMNGSYWPILVIVDQCRHFELSGREAEYFHATKHQ